jgi:triosephosphate isomerase (TIM)
MTVKVLVIANWKMNPTTMRDAKKLFDATKKAAEKMRKSSVVIAPPAIFLRELSAKYRGRVVTFALQTAHYEESGAHTGETSLLQGSDARAHYVIVGHAERREMGETSDDTRKKVAAALAQKMTPVLCVGEKERGAGAEYLEIVREQLRTGLTDVAPANMAKVVITYEPLWAIGKESAMNPHEMHQMAIFIKKTIVDLAGEIGHKVRILYGGSVDEKNVGAMLLDGEVHGFLVGRASIHAEGFASLLKAIETV